MADWSQSHLLQALGWATLNSFWQIGLLWCIYLLVNRFFQFSSSQKYRWAVASTLGGFAWFCASFVLFYTGDRFSGDAYFTRFMQASGNNLRMVLLAASITYLLLLSLPAIRLFQNWRFVQKIRKDHLSKAPIEYRLYVNRIAAHLGINRKVQLFFSELVSAPLTIGNYKPIILLPFAAVNGLATSQIEAILLHELSHIRRYDYLVNLMVSVIQTLLYFNPFVRSFLKEMEVEREHCCDGMVLQFGYDRTGYASALLSIQKMSAGANALAMGATGRSPLLSRIEKIVGIEEKKSFTRRQLAGMMAAILCIIGFNSVIIVKERGILSQELFTPEFATAALPFEPSGSPLEQTTALVKGVKEPSTHQTSLPLEAPLNEAIVVDLPALPSTEVEMNLPAHLEENENPHLIHAAFEEKNAALTAKQAAEVEAVVNNTRKVVSSLKWKELNAAIGEALTETEKKTAFQGYLKALEAAVDFHALEQQLKASYDELNLAAMQDKLDQALVQMKLDSLHQQYNTVLLTLEKARVDLRDGQAQASPLPDGSVEELQRASDEVRKRIKLLKELRQPKKVVRL